MNAYTTNPALEAAIIAHADEDTPRLAYADWLDEHDDSDRAAFIRVQCRLADMPPSHPDWIELREQQDELLVRLKSQNLSQGLSQARRFYFSNTSSHDLGGSYRRGFPYFIDYQTSGEKLKPKETAGMIAELTRLVETTTIRGFHPYELPQSWLVELLGAPVAAQLTGFAVTPQTTGGDPERQVAAFHRAIATSPALGRLRELCLYGRLRAGSIAGADSVAALAASTTLGALRRLNIQELAAPEPLLRKLTRADWFRRLQHFRTGLPRAETAGPMVSGLGELPELHTLELVEDERGAVDALSALPAGTFPALARFAYHGPLGGPEPARALASARFPALVVLQVSGSRWNDYLDDDAIGALLRAEWFEQLHSLNLAHNVIGDKGIKALAAHPVAKQLRVLELSGNKFGKGGLTALAKRGAFPALTALVIGSGVDTYHRTHSTAAELAKFLSALRLPNLRHLDLAGWPLGNAGARALAANPTFAGLTRLDVESCFIGDPGAKAIFASPHLQNLVELRIHGNRIKTGADALADPAVMPRLFECCLPHTLPAATVKKLKRKRPGVIL